MKSISNMNNIEKDINLIDGLIKSKWIICLSS